MGHVDVLAYDPLRAVSAGPKTTADVPVKGGKIKSTDRKRAMGIDRWSV